VRDMQQECCTNKGQGLKRWLCLDVNDYSDAASFAAYILKQLINSTLFLRTRLEIPSFPY
jgi:hypothetical protein